MAPVKTSSNTVLITGGTSGIGQALAAEFLKLGNTVLITSRTEDRLAAARSILPGVQTYVCDQGDPAAIERLRDETLCDFPNLNFLINNAGIGPKRNLHDASVPLADLEREIGINLTGPIQMVHAFLPHLKRQQAATIINVTSGLAFVPLALKPIYSATKAAMHSYTQSLRAQLAHTGVRVIELAPPAVATEFNKGQEEMDAGPRMDPQTFAQDALSGLEAGEDEILPGMAAMLRSMALQNPHAVLRADEAAKMGLPTTD